MRGTAETPPLVGVNAERKEKLRRNLIQSSQSNGTGHGDRKPNDEARVKIFIRVYLCSSAVILWS